MFHRRMRYETSPYHPLFSLSGGVSIRHWKRTLENIPCSTSLLIFCCKILVIICITIDCKNSIVIIPTGFFSLSGVLTGGTKHTMSTRRTVQWSFANVHVHLQFNKRDPIYFEHRFLNNLYFVIMIFRIKDGALCSLQDRIAHWLDFCISENYLRDYYFQTLPWRKKAGRCNILRKTGRWRVNHSIKFEHGEDSVFLLLQALTSKQMFRKHCIYCTRRSHTHEKITRMGMEPLWKGYQ